MNWRFLRKLQNIQTCVLVLLSQKPSDDMSYSSYHLPQIFLDLSAGASIRRRLGLACAHVVTILLRARLPQYSVQSARSFPFRHHAKTSCPSKCRATLAARLLPERAISYWSYRTSDSGNRLPVQDSVQSRRGMLPSVQVHYQVSLPHYKDDLFLKKAVERYEHHFCLTRLYPVVFVVPCYDFGTPTNVIH